MTLNQEEDSVAAEGACSLALLNPLQLSAQPHTFCHIYAPYSHITCWYHTASGDKLARSVDP